MGVYISCTNSPAQSTMQAPFGALTLGLPRRGRCKVSPDVSLTIVPVAFVRGYSIGGPAAVWRAGVVTVLSKPFVTAPLSMSAPSYLNWELPLNRSITHE
jgi:hypothetical protein